MSEDIHGIIINQEIPSLVKETSDMSKNASKKAGYIRTKSRKPKRVMFEEPDDDWEDNEKKEDEEEGEEGDEGEGEEEEGEEGNEGEEEEGNEDISDRYTNEWKAMHRLIKAHQAVIDAYTELLYKYQEE